MKKSNFTIQFLSEQEGLRLTRKRRGETRIGEVAEYMKPEISLEENLQISNSDFVLVGIPEDIGVRANFGRGGAHTAWQPALENVLSIQSNRFFSGKELLVAGALYVEDLMHKSSAIDSKSPEAINTLRSITAELDERVVWMVQTIVKHGKIPIIIGGGHNNAYGNLKGSSLGILHRKNKRNKKLNCINCDAHTDLRATEGRHSGNGFTYARMENCLSKYAVLGVHENYINESADQLFQSNKQNLKLETYEEIFVREKKSFTKALRDCIVFVKGAPCGIELDLDAITNVPSSAKTSSGISPVQARQYVYQCGFFLDAVYLHIAEGAPVLAHIKADNKTGKLIGYLVTDFIKGSLEKKKRK
jgi:formiminoglutamase